MCNMSQTYKKGHKFKLHIDGYERYFRYVDEVIEYIDCTVYFEFDQYDAYILLKDLNKHETVEFRFDCIVTRIA